jgi:hypothetical protein
MSFAGVESVAANVELLPAAAQIAQANADFGKLVFTREISLFCFLIVWPSLYTFRTAMLIWRSK